MESQEKYLLEAFRIAAGRGITIYDALFIALAKEREALLVTSDEKQAAVARLEGVEVYYVK
mgnify:CR=1 FL=1